MKHRSYPTLILCLSLTLWSCSDLEDPVFDENGVAIGLPHLWKAPLTNNDDLAGEIIVTPIVYGEGNILLGSNRDGQRRIISLDADNGMLNWEWDDMEGLVARPDYKGPIFIDRRAYHLNDNLLFFNYRTSSFCIDLNTGRTLWKYESDRDRASNNGGIGDTYFSSGASPIAGFLEPVREEGIYVGNMNSSNEEQLLLNPVYTTVDFPLFNGALNSMAAFENDGQVYLAFGIENPSPSNSPTQRGPTELNLYNITEGKYVYEKISIDARTITDLHYQAPNLYFRSSSYVHCYNAITGDEIWRTDIADDVFPSGIILVDNKLYTISDEDLSCVDATTGSLLWENNFYEGLSTELSYLNGVLYFLGGGDLHAVDGQTGNQLWKISSLDRQTNEAAWFQGVCIAVPGKNGNKGVIVATTGLNAYAYEAAR